MTAVTYTAKRSIIAGHTEDTEYTIDLRVISIDLSKDVRKEPSVALSGKTETVMWRNLKIWQVTTGAVRWSDRELILEFLESTIAGESIEFDEHGTAASPDNAITAIIEGVYNEARTIRQPGVGNDYFRYTFTVREIP